MTRLWFMGSGAFAARWPVFEDNTTPRGGIRARPLYVVFGAWSVDRGVGGVLMGARPGWGMGRALIGRRRLRARGSKGRAVGAGGAGVARGDCGVGVALCEHPVENLLSRDGM